MKLLKDLKINGRVEKILNFDKDDEANNHYIVKPQGRSPITLIELGANDNYVSTESKNKSLKFSKVETEEAGDCITIKLTLGPNKQNNTIPKDIKYNKKDSQNHILLLERTDIPHVILEFGIEGVDKKKLIHIHIEDVVYNAIVDFGSEASQACWLKDSPNPSFINLTSAIRKAIALTTDKDKDFVQYEHDEKESMNFYRSIYFIKKEVSDNNLAKLESWPDYTDTTVRFLVKVTEETEEIAQNYIQIPNTKILNFTTGGYAKNRVTINGDEIEIKDIKEGIVMTMVMNNIIKQTLMSIENNINSTYQKDKACGLILNILMPNVYPIHIVSQKLNQLAENIGQIAGEIPHINGVELRYISESDASLLGYINKHNEKPLKKGAYIIVDAGKGTLDFSLIEVDNKKALTNMRRGGIVGAGAAITYGMVVGLVHEYLYTYCEDFAAKSADKKEALIRHFIYNQILKCDDIAKLNMTMKNIENYKKVYNDSYGEEHKNTETDNKFRHQFEQLNLSEGGASFNKVVESWINSKHYLTKESSKYVTAEIEMIVYEALKRMKTALDKETAKVVVFTGRGCLMKELRVKLKKEMIAHRLLEDYDDNELVPEETMKTGCMYINQLLTTGSYDTAESHQSFSILNRFEGKDDKKGGKEKKKETKQEEVDTIDQLRNKIEERGISSILGGYRHAKESSGNLAHGTDIGKIENAMSLINIGGWLYSIDKRFVDKNCKIFFDGTQYIITADGVEPQELNNAVIEGSQVAKLGFESLFPNINVDDEKEENIIVIPQIPEMEKTTEEITSESEKDALKEEENTSPNSINETEEEQHALEKIKNKLGRFFKKHNKEKQ